MQPALKFLLLSQRMKQLYASMCAPVCARHQLTQLELDIVLFLANNPGLDTASDIVEVRMITKSHVSTTVESLIDKGLLTRHDDPSDRRRVRLRHTEHANKVIFDAREMQAAFAERLCKGLGDSEKEQIDSLASRMLENIM